MKIHYISCHSVLEYDEVKLFTEMGHDVKSNGAYRDPRGAYTLPRPGIPGMQFDQEWFDLTGKYPKTNLPPEMIEPFDVLIFMSGEQNSALIQNWEKIKHKRVILRTIGQNTASNEIALQKLVSEGLQVVRYSPKEKNIPNYVGQDAMIRFYKDEDELKGWTGQDNRPITFVQSLKGRGQACHYDEIMGSMIGFDGAKVYGPGNNDLGSLNGGEMDYEMVKNLMRESRLFVSAGTWPASYTLSFMEAIMTGMPIVAASKKIAHISNYEALNFYEVDEIVEHGVDGFICDDVSEMRSAISELLANDMLAQRVSENARAKAIETFGKQTIKAQWQAFLG